MTQMIVIEKKRKKEELEKIHNYIQKYLIVKFKLKN